MTTEPSNRHFAFRYLQAVRAQLEDQSKVCVAELGKFIEILADLKAKLETDPLETAARFQTLSLMPYAYSIDRPLARLAAISETAQAVSEMLATEILAELGDQLGEDVVTRLVKIDPSVN